MASPSKEERVLKLILENSSLKEWHFEEVVAEAQVTRAVASKWLHRYVQEGLLRKVKEKGKFPHFKAGERNLVYLSRKRLYALEKLYGSGLIAALMALEARTVMIFGSFARGDWHARSDIDIFILGNDSGFKKHIYESRLRRHIELHVFKDYAELRAVKSGLLGNVANGYLVKGDVADVMAARN